jgi:hypothetical protein
MSGRTPEQILAELGAELERAAAEAGGPGAWRGERGQRLTRLARPLAVGLTAALALAGTAVGTRNVWAPDPPPSAGAARAGGPSAFVAAGGSGSVRWRLSAQACRDGRVALYLFGAHGAGGRGCAAAPRAIQTYYDAAADRTLAFGAAPPGAASVQVSLRSPGPAPRLRTATAGVQRAPADVARRAGLPRGTAYFVVAVPGALTSVEGAIARDAGGAPVMTCEEGSCASR